MTAAGVLGYILGSVPFAVLVARRHGVDILKVGSGNPGATNVKRVLGRGPGNLVFLLDALKGTVAAGWPALAALALAWVDGNSAGAASGIKEATFASLAGEGGASGVFSAFFGLLRDGEKVAAAQLAGFVGAVLGHCFSLFLRFRGGKGVAVSAGGLLGVMPVCLGASGIVWLVVFCLTRYVFAASLAAGVSLPVVTWFWFSGAATPQFWISVAVAAFLVFTHRENIRRWRAGTENRFSKKTPS